MGILDNIEEGINEIFENTINKLPTIGEQSPQFNPIPEGTKEIQQEKEKRDGTYKDDAWNIFIKENEARINSVLEQRSYLDFYFPNNEIGIRRVAFFENPEIVEGRAARYASQNIVARNEPVRLYVGSDPRRVRVNFNYTLPHIAQFWSMLTTPPGYLTEEELNKYNEFVLNVVGRFFGSAEVLSLVAQSGTGFKNDDNSIGPFLYESNGSYKTAFQESGLTPNHEEYYLKYPLTQWSLEPKDMTNTAQVAANYTQYVIDTLRASVVGDLTKIGPQGPPIVRFRHGTVFNESPFIVRNFNINYPKDKGFEVKTLVPRVLKFTINLEEFRQTHGAFHGDENELLPGSSEIIDLNKRRSLNG